MFAQNKEYYVSELATQGITPFTVFCKNSEAVLFRLVKNELLIVYEVFLSEDEQAKKSLRFFSLNDSICRDNLKSSTAF